MSVPVQAEPEAGADRLSPRQHVLNSLILETVLGKIIDIERRLDALEAWKYQREERGGDLE